MSAASGARLAAPDPAIASDLDGRDHDHGRLTLAPVDGVVTGAERDDARADAPSPSGRDVRPRLAPLAEPPARRLRADTPAHIRPPVLGSAEALARPAAVTRSPRPGQETDPAGPLPDPTRVCCAMVQAAVESLRGTRPLAQLTRWVSPEVYEQLALRAALVQGAGTPPGTGRAGIRRIRVCRIGHDAAEATVVVDDGPRVRAVAVRLEGHRGRWRATAMEIG